MTANFETDDKAAEASTSPTLALFEGGVAVHRLGHRSSRLESSRLSSCPSSSASQIRHHRPGPGPKEKTFDNPHHPASPPFQPESCLSPAMDAIGGGLSVPATVKLLVGAIRLCCDFADDIRDWNDDSRKLALRMSLQVSLTQHLQNLLFGSAASHPNSNDEAPLFHKLSPSLQRDVCSMIFEFYNVIESKYNTLKQTYGLKSPNRPPLLPAQFTLSV